MRSPLLMLVVLNLSLVGGLLASWFYQDFELKNVEWVEPKAIAVASDLLLVSKPNPINRDVSTFHATLERPLFWPSRRPPLSLESEKVAEPDPFVDIHLFGLVDGGETKIAIVRAGGKIRRLKVGELIGAWTFDAMEGRYARFSGANGESRTLELKYVIRQAPSASTLSDGTVGARGEGDAVVRMADGSTRTVDEAISERRARREAARARAKAAGQIK